MVQEYYEWLCDLVTDKYDERTFDILLGVFARTDFEILIPGDMDRALDGIELRMEFDYSSEDQDVYDYMEGAPCSVLEMLIALARRIGYELSGNDPDEPDETGRYFWMMVDNLDLSRFDDEHYADIPNAGKIIEDRLKGFLERDYSYSGDGGLFPLRWPERDQRDVELLYQKNAYLNENFPV